MKRTICDCNDCKTFCKFIPGYLIYEDIEKIHNYFRKDQINNDFYREYLRASPGAIVGIQGKITRIQTIVPARNSITGYCIFFNEKTELCKIHSVAPFGCAYFDPHMSREEGDHRSKLGIISILQNEKYLDIWHYLNNRNLKSKGPEELRKCDMIK